MTAGAVTAVAGARIEAVGIGRTFGPVHALAGVDLTIAAGEIVALLGPSGSGKSTLLRIIAGLDQPTAGDLRFDDRSQVGVPPHQRDVSMVFQHFALYPHLSATDNLVLALRYGRGMSRADARDRAAETLRMLGIADLARRRPAQMSGGQRQRVAIGRAIATRARVVLLDEPMSGLDAKLRVELRVEIVDLLRRLGTTAVFVTHDQAEAMAVGDRVAVMNHGAIEQIGTPDAIYDLPATRFVATFVGSPPMNVFEGTWSDGQLRGPGSGFVVPAPAAATAVGVRPEHLRLVRGASGPSAGGEFSVQGHVVVAERLGAERTMYVRTATGMVGVRVDAAVPVVPDEPVTVTAPATALLCFGPDGRALTVPQARQPS
ncbi:ABC transporter [Parafrankia colletiae]|uniref:ABC transporter n=1 Tax=Parafrankia colletiae TaxID=573497 RepID=A0A1S1QVL6_9ACTN|nr:ABC transporter ATP-binding protein [Parafrankia colletiae]MCK9899210.1 ABC transporter ATP-binding protein [Frankia sp. Cpl3]OHV38753.1 ABC transporter [Parafrankia colletiae]